MVVVLPASMWAMTPMLRIELQVEVGFWPWHDPAVRGSGPMHVDIRSAEQFTKGHRDYRK